MGALDDRFGPGTEAELTALYTLAGFTGQMETVEVYNSGIEQGATRIYMRWYKDDVYAGLLKIDWYYDDTLHFANMTIEPDFQGQGIYKHICRPVIPAWYKVHGLKYGTASGSATGPLGTAGKFKNTPSHERRLAHEQSKWVL